MILLISTIAIQLVYAEYSGTYRIFTGLIFLSVLLFLVYFNINVLVPRFLFRNKLLKYTLCLSGCILFMLVVLIILQACNPSKTVDITETPVPLFTWLNLFTNIIVVGLLMSGFSAGLFFQHWLRFTQQISELETATMQSELESLKNQISPHFLFNMLNNANVLTKENPEEAARIIFKLNDLLKYQFNELDQGQVLLENEMHFLSDFLNLEKIRRDCFEFSVQKEGDTNLIMVPPFLFIPFVENAVKHNNDNKNLSYVHLLFKITDEYIYFECTNSKPARLKNNFGKEYGGLGLTNIQRRLDLLYGNDYSLKITDEENKFHIKLVLNKIVRHVRL